MTGRGRIHARHRVLLGLAVAMTAATIAASTARVGAARDARRNAPPGRALSVGSKNFTEGYILSEILAEALETAGFRVERRFGLGGTLVCYEALVNGEIDVYPEYSGTLAQAILDLPGRVSYGDLQRRLREDTPVELLETFGFNNTYAIALARTRAVEMGVETIGDLRRYPELRFAFSHEFINRNDGWPGLKRTYGLPEQPAGIEHGLAYQAIAEGKIDVTDVYSTDGDIEKYDLFLLADDRAYFPVYMAAPLVRADAAPEVKAALAPLAGRIDESRMRALNRAVLVEGKSFREVASAFLAAEGLGGAAGDSGDSPGRWRALARRTGRHLELTLIALIASMCVAIPAGVLVYRSRRVARPVIYVAGALQTIPSIALLAFMIPLFGIGVTPAIVALFLYALLPILRNTASALFAIDPVLKKVAVGMGLTVYQRLRYVEIPLAAPTILAGIKTAAVINIGTATLAAFIGAGGLGEPIVTGLALNDTSLILEGAVPAAALAILTELFFEAIERFLVPRHLSEKPAE
jgi:osmoprotectant transport system permease protein